MLELWFGIFLRPKIKLMAFSAIPFFCTKQAHIRNINYVFYSNKIPNLVINP